MKVPGIVYRGRRQENYFRQQLIFHHFPTRFQLVIFIYPVHLVVRFFKIKGLKGNMLFLRLNFKNFQNGRPKEENLEVLMDSGQQCWLWWLVDLGSCAGTATIQLICHFLLPESLLVFQLRPVSYLSLLLFFPVHPYSCQSGLINLTSLLLKNFHGELPLAQNLKYQNGIRGPLFFGSCLFSLISLYSS